MPGKHDILILENGLRGVTGGEGHVENISPVGGGSINSCFSFIYHNTKFFLKVNSALKFPGMFEAEAAGLKKLKEANALKIPDVIWRGEGGSVQFLVLEFLERKAEDAAYFSEFGKQLAIQHKQTNSFFGSDTENYIGSLKQVNTPANGWEEFFIVSRIEPLLRKAIDSGELPGSASGQFNMLFNKLPGIFPKEYPALLHGDLWSGNKMNTTSGPCIFDPSVYYGHREMDIAMTTLFGGFTRDFYHGYHENFPLEAGWEERVDVFNLYPLLVHVNLFGGSYALDVLDIVGRF